MKTAAVLFASAMAMIAYTVNARSTADLPEGWSIGGEAAKLYAVDIDRSDSPSGAGSVVLRRTETSHAFGAAHLARSFPVTSYAGKQVRVSMRALYEGDGKTPIGHVFIGGSAGEHVTGRGVSAGWHLYQMTITLPADLRTLSVGVALQGAGVAKVDSIDLDVIGDAPAGHIGLRSTDLLIDGQGSGKDGR